MSLQIIGRRPRLRQRSRTRARWSLRMSNGRFSPWSCLNRPEPMPHASSIPRWMRRERNGADAAAIILSSSA